MNDRARELQYDVCRHVEVMQPSSLKVGDEDKIGRKDIKIQQKLGNSPKILPPPKMCAQKIVTLP